MGAVPEPVYLSGIDRGGCEGGRNFSSDLLSEGVELLAVFVRGDEIWGQVSGARMSAQRDRQPHDAFVGGPSLQFYRVELCRCLDGVVGVVLEEQADRMLAVCTGCGGESGGDAGDVKGRDHGGQGRLGDVGEQVAVVVDDVALVAGAFVTVGPRRQ